MYVCVQISMGEDSEHDRAIDWQAVRDTMTTLGIR